jgi:hypothetical protein
MQTMHLVMSSALSESRNHADFGSGGGIWTPGGQGVAGSNPVSPTSESRKPSVSGTHFSSAAPVPVHYR